MRPTTTPQTIAALLLTACAFATTAQATPQTIATMRDHRRIILIAAPQANDTQAAAQTAILSHWKKQADERDISVITITGLTVTGAADKAEALRHRYQLKPDSFQVLLIGKDGHVAIRSAHPITAENLQSAIDAMPMRQAGLS
ncbi:DUF4174 domain-containing protein [Novosphingobium sp.]|uniref:DUF4174 domain-containing protein n=1 Tax=Novosphingobium sp. TaxID=1874826 RepID=UPI003B516671